MLGCERPRCPRTTGSKLTPKVGGLVAHSGSHVLTFLAGALVVLVVVTIWERLRKRPPDPVHESHDQEVGPG